MRKLTTGLAIAAVSIVGLGFGAGAYPPGAATMTISPATVAPGGTVTATLSGCTLGEVVTVTIQGGDSATASCAGPAGSVRPTTAAGPSATVTLTAPTAPGTYSVIGTGATSGVVATATLTVAAATGGALPTTGTDSAPTIQIAAGVLIAGLALAGVALYRRRSPTAA